MVGQTKANAARVRFDERGLTPCVIQDSRSGEVLTLAYMNEEALRLTLETGEMHLYSRSRDEIWHKGATSGNIQRVTQLRYDCDGDAVVALVEPAGPACHTGQRSCFYRDLEGTASSEVDGPPAAGEPVPVPFEALAELERTLLARKRERPTGSYTVELLEDPSLAGSKVREEAREVAKAVSSESEERVAEEGADVVYHLAVLLLSRGVSMAEVASDPQRAPQVSTATAPLPGLEPDLDRARELAKDANVIPVRFTFVDDTETPVSAFLKLRGEGPSFLLESAEQGRLGRWSFLGFRPRSILRWSDGVLSEWDGGVGPEGPPDRTSEVSDPYARRRRVPGPLRDRRARAAAAVLRRGRRRVRLRPRADGRDHAGRAQSRHDRPARHGADDQRRADRLRPPAARGLADRQRLRRGRRHRAGLRAGGRDDRLDPRAAARAGAEHRSLSRVR